MPRTRGNATTGADAEAPTPAHNEVNVEPDPSPLNEGTKTASIKQKSRKRKTPSSKDEKPRKQKTHGGRSYTGQKARGITRMNLAKPAQKPKAASDNSGSGVRLRSSSAA